MTLQWAAPAYIMYKILVAVLVGICLAEVEQKEPTVQLDGDEGMLGLHLRMPNNAILPGSGYTNVRQRAMERGCKRVLHR